MAKTTDYDKRDFARVMAYWRKLGHSRNYTLMSVLCLTALRVSDAICLKWSHFFCDTGMSNCRSCIFLEEHKTKKVRQIDITPELKKVLLDYYAVLVKAGRMPGQDEYIFQTGYGSSRHLSRTQAYRIVRRAGESQGLQVSCHSLRKTFGHFANKKKISIAALQRTYMHSSPSITATYICAPDQEISRTYTVCADVFREAQE